MSKVYALPLRYEDQRDIHLMSGTPKTPLRFAHKAHYMNGSGFVECLETIEWDSSGLVTTVRVEKL